MNKNLNKIIVAILAACTVAAGVITHWDMVRYLHDCILGFYIEAAETLMPSSPTYTIVDHRSYRPQVRTYRDLPEGFIHSGSLLMYRAGGEDEDLGDIASGAVGYTDYYRASSLASAIRDYNGLRGSDVPAGTALVIPGSAPALRHDPRNQVMPPLIAARGLYFTGTSLGGNKILGNLDRFRELGINTIVFDAKDIGGDLSYYSRVPEVQRLDTHEKRSIDNIEKFIRTLKENGFYTVARMAVFHDHLLRKKDRSLAIQSRGGGAWSPGAKEKWCDPTNRKVQDYNIAMAVELAELGVDEIQFDYIRFPTTGNQGDIAFKYDFGKMSREQAITHFLKRAHDAIAARKSRLSIDIFGVVAWGKTVDINSTGQRIELLARHCDIISPMLYPSHFNDDFDGYARPGDNPYYFIYSGCQKVIALAGKNAIVRPWLQAFRWRVSNYNSQYIKTQIKATDESGAKGYLFWNAANDYDTVMRALEDMNGVKTARDDTKDN
ncbi:MAG: hypothetical protein KA369_09510 [Spirochaetes bacterium]|nr:hypothetical protein [Spirochaetota bacterium]